MRARLTASVVAASLVLAGTAGCTFLTPQATQMPYDPSDGVRAQVGDVRLLNAMLLTDDGETASLLVTVANGAKRSATVNVQYQDASGQRVDESVHVNASSMKTLGAEQQLVLRDVDAQPGSLFPIYVQQGGEQGVEMLVPVMDGTLPEYADYVPSLDE